jgi:soluble lytic murein transglycosylase-like protein
MANLSVAVPVATLQSPSSWGSRSSIKGQLEKIWNNYGTFISNASKNSNIPKSIIAAFIAVESGGNPSAGSAGHITQGLMQWNRTYAQKQLQTELSKNRMTEGEKEVLRRFNVMDSSGNIRAVTNADQLNPELNITIGTIVLGQLLDTPWATDERGLHLDRVIAVYNAGAYGDTGKKARQLTTPKLNTPQLLASNVNSITSSYINKMLGKDGAMDIATSDLKTIIG